MSENVIRRWINLLKTDGINSKLIVQKEMEACLENKTCLENKND